VGIATDGVRGLLPVERNILGAGRDEVQRARSGLLAAARLIFSGRIAYPDDAGPATIANVHLGTGTEFLFELTGAGRLFAESEISLEHPGGLDVATVRP
jgi:hypothetical protein